MPGSNAAERLTSSQTAPPPDGARTPAEAERRHGSHRSGRLVRVDRLSMILTGVGLVLVLVVTVFITLLVSGGGSHATPGDKPADGGGKAGPSITLNGPDVARYITENYPVRGVTCPTLSVPIDGSFVCSDPDGNAFTVRIVDHGRAYTVHPD